MTKTSKKELEGLRRCIQQVADANEKAIENLGCAIKRAENDPVTRNSDSCKSPNNGRYLAVLTPVQSFGN